MCQANLGIPSLQSSIEPGNRLKGLESIQGFNMKRWKRRASGLRWAFPSYY